MKELLKHAMRSDPEAWGSVAASEHELVLGTKGQ